MNVVKIAGSVNGPTKRWRTDGRRFGELDASAQWAAVSRRGAAAAPGGRYRRSIFRFCRVSPFPCSRWSNLRSLCIIAFGKLWRTDCAGLRSFRSSPTRRVSASIVVSFFINRSRRLRLFYIILRLNSVLDHVNSPSREDDTIFVQ